MTTHAPAPPALGTSGQLAAMLRAELKGPADLPLADLRPIDAAHDRSLTFIRSEKYAARWAESRAAAAIVTRAVPVPGHDPQRRALLIVDDADEAMVTLLAFVQQHLPKPPPQDPGIHPTAVIHPAARLGRDVRIGPACTVAAGASLGDRSTLAAGVHIGAAATIGDDADIRHNAVVYPNVIIGKRVLIHAGAVLGADGFGFIRKKGDHRHTKVPHLASVRIGDDVEIGANTCIDQGKLEHTTVGDGTKLDNLIQIGHSCRIGNHVVICGNAAIGGSVVIGDHATLGGHVSIPDGLVIHPHAVVGGGAMVMNDIPPGEPWFGFPARPHNKTLRIMAAYFRLPELFTRFRDLVKRVENLEQKP